MATRTNATDVRAILGESDLEDSTIDAYITTAYVLVTKTLSGKLSEDVLEQIEKWMACHFIATTQERQIKKAGAGGASVEYVGEFGFGFDSTTFGQTMLLLDTTDTLKNLGKKQARMFAIKTVH